MKNIVIDGSNLTLEQIWEISLQRANVVLSDSAKSRINTCREEIERIVNNDQVVYGINTGFGSLKNRKIAREQLKKLQRNLIISHSTGVGNYLPVQIVRAIMLLRINSLSRGFSGIRLSTLQTLIDMLNKGVHPAVPEKGSVGASGDLAPISHIMLVLCKDETDDVDEESGRVIIKENFDRDNTEIKTISGKEAMKKAGIERVVLDAKEGLALNNGTNVMTAIAAISLHEAEILLHNSVKIFCASLEALKGVSHAYFRKIHEIRNQKGQLEIADLINEYRKGSMLVDSRPGEVQDSYSLRCFPQVAGAVKDTIDMCHDVFERESNAVTDNPLIFHDIENDQKFYSGGNFHGEPVALYSDFLKIALTELGNISERRIFKMTSEFLNNGLPSMLSLDPGLNSGVMIMQYTAAALTSENKVIAHPASVDTIPTSEDVEDHVSMGTIAARQSREILENVRRILAIELIVACQALELRQKCEDDLSEKSLEEILSGSSYNLLMKLRNNDVSFWDKDRVAYPDIEKTIKLLHEKL